MTVDFWDGHQEDWQCVECEGEAEERVGKDFGI